MLLNVGFCNCKFYFLKEYIRTRNQFKCAPPELCNTLWSNQDYCSGGAPTGEKKWFYSDAGVKDNWLRAALSYCTSRAANSTEADQTLKAALQHKVSIAVSASWCNVARSLTTWGTPSAVETGSISWQGLPAIITGSQQKSLKEQGRSSDAALLRVIIQPLEQNVEVKYRKTLLIEAILRYK